MNGSQGNLKEDLQEYRVTELARNICEQWDIGLCMAHWLTLGIETCSLLITVQQLAVMSSGVVVTLVQFKTFMIDPFHSALCLPPCFCRPACPLLSHSITQGQSWSIGGDPNAQTVATFLRFYTPNIVGASLGNKTLTNLEVSVYIAWWGYISKENIALTTNP